MPGAGVYLAIVGDIVASRKLDNRAHWQRTLEKLMTRLNCTYSDSLESLFVVTLGDEFQALLTDTRALAGLWRELGTQQLPFSVRVGVGMGGISTDLKPIAIGMDGPAFHRAREAVNWLKTHGGFLRISTGNEDADCVANSIVALCEAVKVGWTPRQVDLYSHMHMLSNQKQIADSMGVNPSVVSRMLRRMHVKEVAQGESVILYTLDQLLREEHQM